MRDSISTLLEIQDGERWRGSVHCRPMRECGTSVAVERSRDGVGPRVEAGAGTVRLVVVERRTTSFELHAPPDGSDHTIVAAQGREEGDLEFACRTIERIASLDREGRQIVLAMMVLEPRFDPERLRARSSAVRALMEHAAGLQSSRSRLVLINGGRWLSAREQRALFSWVGALMSQHNAWSLPIRVRLEARGPSAMPSRRQIQIPDARWLIAQSRRRRTAVASTPRAVVEVAAH